MTEEIRAKAKSLGAIKEVVVGEGDTAKVAYFKKPHRYVLGLAFAKLNTNPVEANEIVIKNCIIPEVSNMEMLEDDDYFFGLMPHVSDLLEVKKNISRAL